MYSNSIYNYLKKKFDLTVVVIWTTFFPIVGIWIADSSRHLYSKFDPDNVFVWNFIHHLVQMLLAIIVILLSIWNKPIKNWGFNLNNKSWSLNIFWKFCIGWIIFLTIGTILFQWSSNSEPIIKYPLTTRNITGNLSFMFTMPGLSEEILFRALAIGILLKSWGGRMNFGIFRISATGLIATIIFTLAHFGYTIQPFQIDYIEPMQLLFAFGLGIFYAVMLEKTGSLLGPILVHNASDGLGTVIYLIVTALTYR